jgi:hypothetical protein
MQRLKAVPFLLAMLACSYDANSQTVLSQNSGINSSDTWATMDLTIQNTNVAINLPTPMYNPATGTTSSTGAPTIAARTMHVETGYDATGGLVMNLWPNGSKPSPTKTDTDSVGFVRIAGGQITVFDSLGNALPVLMPGQTGPTNWPMNLLGGVPGPSILASIVVPVAQTHPISANATLTVNSNPATATMTVPLSGGGASSVDLCSIG